MSSLRRLGRFLFVFALAVAIFPALPSGQALSVARAQEPEPGWPMAGANPQRTSWSAEVIDPSRFVLEWYRPIEAYIPQNAQIVAANGLLYISSARGLYALDATTGEVAWRFDTQLPVGHSPTVDGGVVYFGGYDRKLHALNALTGAPLWEYSGAKAGFSTNPLVVEGRVIAGNRDGVMYAVGAQGTPQQGRLLWSFTVGAPIYQSAAYKDGVLYFAGGDNRAYALRAADGELVWRSHTLPGEQYQSYWPVIYRDKVVFAGASQYRPGMMPGTRSAFTPTNSRPESYLNITDDALWHDVPDGAPKELGPVVPVTEPWAHGLTVVNASLMSEYLEDDPDGDPWLHKPYRRLYAVLNRADGSEYSQDVDGDGNKDYAPIAYFGTKSGNMYPPVVLGVDDVIYQNSLTSITHNVRGRVVGWNMGTSQLSFATLETAADEPQAVSAGGSVIYRNICCDRVGNWTNIETGKRGMLWDYSNPLTVKAPGYDVMWWGTEYPGNLSRLVGAFGNPNGIYHSHGDQNPIVPYAGRLYVHRSNAILAFGPGPSAGARPLLTVNPTVDSVQPPPVRELTARLEEQVQKIVDAGNLNPAYNNVGQFMPRILKTAFENPGETLHTLSRAYPYLSPPLQQQLKDYLQQQFATYFNPTMYAGKGWSDGVPRESMEFPPDLAASFATQPKRISMPGWSFTYPQHNFYALWKYAQIVPEDALAAYNLAKSKLQLPMPDTDLIQERPYEHNAFIAGYIGFLNLQELAGKATVDATLRAQVVAELERVKALRVSRFDKDTPLQDPTGTYPEGNVHFRGLNLARNFMYMVPEFSEYMRQNLLTEVEEALVEYNWVGAYWFVSRYETAVDEGAASVPYTSQALFHAKAYILQEPYDELTKYLDVPSSAVGDLYYIENLIAALDASDGSPVPTPTATAAAGTATPTVAATATRTPTVTATATASATGTPTPDPGQNMTLHVGDLDAVGVLGSYDRWIARVTIEVHDNEETPVSGVLVSAVWSESDKGEATCTTNAVGFCRVSASGLLRNGVPTIGLTINGLSLAGYDYAPALSHDPDGDSDGTSIVVVQP